MSKIRANMLEQGQVATVNSILDPNDDAAAYLRAMADGHVFNVHTDPTEIFAEKKTMEEILLSAIGFEKDSIAFYLGMIEMVPENLGKGQVNHIIKEEMRHIAFLNKAIAAQEKIAVVVQ